MLDIASAALFAALTLLFACTALFFVKIVAATNEKKEFFSACLCSAGAVAIALFFCHQIWLPVDQSGCTHEAAWEDFMMSSGMVALAIGHCAQSWQTRSFFPAVAGVALIYMGTIHTVHAILPAVLKQLLFLIGILLLPSSSKVWGNPEIAMRGGFFSKLASVNFKK